MLKLIIICSCVGALIQGLPQPHTSMLQVPMQIHPNELGKIIPKRRYQFQVFRGAGIKATKEKVTKPTLTEGDSETIQKPNWSLEGHVDYCPLPGNIDPHGM